MLAYIALERAEEQHPPVEYNFSGHCDDITTNRLFYYAENAENRFFFPFSLLHPHSPFFRVSCVNVDDDDDEEKGRRKLSSCPYE